VSALRIEVRQGMQTAQLRMIPDELQSQSRGLSQLHSKTRDPINHSQHMLKPRETGTQDSTRAIRQNCAATARAVCTAAAAFICDALAHTAPCSMRCPYNKQTTRMQAAKGTNPGAPIKHGKRPHYLCWL